MQADVSTVTAPSLFLGFLVDREFTERLKGTRPSVVELFTRGGEDYLESHFFNDQKYLGKRLGSLTDLSTLEATEKNIESLIQRMAPRESIPIPSLVILTLPPEG